MGFKLVSPFQPAGDQPQATEQLVRGLGGTGVSPVRSRAGSVN